MSEPEQSSRRKLDGPRLSPKGAQVRSLVVLVHGYGASGDDLIELGRALQGVLPTTAFAAPNAPDRLPYEGAPGYQWFGLAQLSPAELWVGVQTAAPALQGFVDDELGRLGLSPDRLALVGFSQGTMMTLHVGLRQKIAPAGLVGLSGVIAGPEHLEAQVTCRPPALLVHGEEDEVIPVAALDMTREALAKAHVPVTWHKQPGLGHGIDQAMLQATAQFLAARLR